MIFHEMYCTTPTVPPSKVEEIEKFTIKFKEMADDFVKTLHLPSALDPAVLSYESRIATYYVSELEDSNIIKYSVKYSVENAIQGLPLSIDTFTVINDISEAFIVFVGNAKLNRTFGDYCSTTYPGTFFGDNVLYEVILALYSADASKLYEFESTDKTRYFRLAYHVYLVIQKPKGLET
ncbi:hypothetical protein Clacol_000905 [Clathrus columnatus]|uniref:Uncharacterized protein n=1 Tax=Clathrus columnatus TaxID=1419009 RepID=A0AAV5A0B7_9AGAM|nr:hypothetical protein Clacol_000905 [Clathrus columnatus]